MAREVAGEEEWRFDACTGEAIARRCRPAEAGDKHLSIKSVTGCPERNMPFPVGGGEAVGGQRSRGVCTPRTYRTCVSVCARAWRKTWTKTRRVLVCRRAASVERSRSGRKIGGKLVGDFGGESRERRVDRACGAFRGEGKKEEEERGGRWTVVERREKRVDRRVGTKGTHNRYSPGVRASSGCAICLG